MKVKVRGYLTLKTAMGDNGLLEVETEKATIRKVLVELYYRFGGEFKDMIVDPATGEISPNVKILVNGRRFISLPGQLDNELDEGDEVGLFPPLAGG
jgi:MoaD family protein